MNFKHMPEFEWRWGYPMVIGIAITTAAGLLLVLQAKEVAVVGTSGAYTVDTSLYY